MSQFGSLSLAQATKSYAARAGRIQVFAQLDLDVAPGEVVCVLGPSGCGKSTLLRVLAGLEPLDSGRALSDGEEIRGPDPRRSLVFQDFALFPWLSVADNVAFGPRARGRTDGVDLRVRELLDLVGLSDDAYAARFPDELSGGQRQRVGVARALAADPPVLLMDEPFGALDPITRRQLQQEFRRIQATVAKCVILVTHDVAEALALGDRVGVMEGGRLIWHGAPDAIADAGDPRVHALVQSSFPVARAETPPRS